jgi:uncharacterized damage-inducible protein DinB
MIESFRIELGRYRATAEKALAQVPDEALNRVPVQGGNSMAMLVRHLAGNLRSRFTDFLTSDGEKPWRHRDAEFEERAYTRSDVEALWAEGWAVVEQTLAALTDADLTREVRIRGQALSVHDALARASAHVAYHVGQLVLLARLEQGGAWQWISIPKGASEQYNRAPTKEKGPQ